MLYLNVFLIELIFVIGLDVLHFWDEISTIISGWITKGKVKKSFELKPLSCSTCLTAWTGWAYVIFSGEFSIFNMAYVIVIAMLAPELGSLIFMFKSWLAKLINKLTIEK